MPEGQAGHTGLCLNRNIVGHTVCERTRLAKGANRAIHYARRVLAYRVVVDPQPLHHTGAERLDNHVRRGSQFHEQFDALWLFQINNQAALATMSIAKKHRFVMGAKTDVSCRLALARRFNADDIGTVISHHHGQMRRSEERRVGQECRSRWSPYHQKRRWRSVRICSIR